MDSPPRSLIEHFSSMNDPRIERSRRHKLIDIIVIGVVGSLCGAESWEDVEMIAEEKQSWLGKFLELPNGIPSHDTVSRVFARFSATEFERCFCAWIVADLFVTFPGYRLLPNKGIVQ